MNLELVYTFLSASIILTLMPGPDNLFVIAESIVKGKKNGITISLGLVSGVLVHTLVAAFGIALIIKESQFIYTIIKYAGILYIVYLSIETLKEKSEAYVLDTTSKQHFNFWRLYKKGFLMNILNPKVSLFFIAFLPQFVDYSSALTVSKQMVCLGLIFFAQALIIFSLLAIISGYFNKFLNNQKFWHLSKCLKFSVLVLIALALTFNL